MKKLLLCLLVLVLAGCKDQVPSAYTKVDPVTYGGLKYQDDPETGIRCYRFQNFEGISCVKVKE